MKVIARFTNAANQPWYNVFWFWTFLSSPAYLPNPPPKKILKHSSSWKQLVILNLHFWREPARNIDIYSFFEICWAVYWGKHNNWKGKHTKTSTSKYSPFPHFREGTSGARDESKLCKISWLVHWNANWILQTLPNDQSCALICTVYFPNCVA